MRKGLPQHRISKVEHELRRKLESDWLAEPGSKRERQLLRNWARHKSLDDRERQQILHWVENPTASRNELFWNSAKHSILGTVMYDNAMMRHKELDDRLWLVGCFIARGLTEKEIAELLSVHPTTIDNAVDALKEYIRQYYGCEIGRIKSAQIAGWFFGL
jgi:ATP/maltotriose-dependent transcriptional regulator MalT